MSNKIIKYFEAFIAGLFLAILAGCVLGVTGAMATVVYRALIGL